MSDFPLVALSDIVIIEQLEEEQTKGGIILVGGETKFPCGRVVAVGPGRVYSTFMDATGSQQVGQFIPTALKVGDWVLFGRYQSAGEPIELDGKRYVMARETDIAAISRDGNPVSIKLALEKRE